MQNDTHIQDLAFRNVKVLTMEDEIWGLPAKIFMMGMALVASFSFIMFWWAGILVGIVYFVPMYEIHKEDPRAFEVWRRALIRSHNYWQAGRQKPTRLVILSRYNQ